MEKIIMKNVFYDTPQDKVEQPKRPVFATIEHEDEAIILSNLLDDVYVHDYSYVCLLYTSPSPRDRQKSRMPSSA